MRHAIICTQGGEAYLVGTYDTKEDAQRHADRRQAGVASGMTFTVLPVEHVHRRMMDVA